MASSKEANNVQLDVPGVVDTKREGEGEWFFHTPEPESGEKAQPNQLDGFRHLLLDDDNNGFRGVLVRSRFTKEYTKDEAEAQARMIRMKPKARQAFSRTMANQLSAKHCVADWDFTDRHGKAIPFSIELAETLMTDSRYRHHANFITVAIATLQGDLEQVVEDDSGN